MQEGLELKALPRPPTANPFRRITSLTHRRHLDASGVQKFKKNKTRSPYPTLTVRSKLSHIRRNTVTHTVKLKLALNVGNLDYVAETNDTEMAMRKTVGMVSSHTQSSNTTLLRQVNFDALHRVDLKFPVAQQSAVPFTIMHKLC